MRENKLTSADPLYEKEQAWKKNVNELAL